MMLPNEVAFAVPTDAAKAYGGALGRFLIATEGLLQGCRSGFTAAADAANELHCWANDLNAETETRLARKLRRLAAKLRDVAADLGLKVMAAERKDT